MDNISIHSMIVTCKPINTDSKLASAASYRSGVALNSVNGSASFRASQECAPVNTTLPDCSKNSAKLTEMWRIKPSISYPHVMKLYTYVIYSCIATRYTVCMLSRIWSFLLFLIELSFFWYDCYRRWQGKETQLRSQSFILGDTIQ